MDFRNPSKSNISAFRPFTPSPAITARGIASVGLSYAHAGPLQGALGPAGSAGWPEAFGRCLNFLYSCLSFSLPSKQLLCRRHDTRYDDTRHDDTWHSDIQRNIHNKKKPTVTIKYDIIQNDTLHNNENEAQNDDTQHNNKKVTRSTTLC